MRGAEHASLVDTWLRYAREDLGEAETSVARSGAIPRHACFLAQQAAEKAIKAVLVFLQLDFPRTHNLDALRNLIPKGWALTTEHPDLGELSGWVTEARYPDDLPDATAADARAAVRQARAVWDSVRRDFAAHGLPVADVADETA